MRQQNRLKRVNLDPDPKKYKGAPDAAEIIRSLEQLVSALKGNGRAVRTIHITLEQFRIIEQYRFGFAEIKPPKRQYFFKGIQLDIYMP